MSNTRSVVSANDTIVAAGSAAAITDASGHRWTISAANTVLEDGKAALPDEGTVRPLSVRLIDGDIYVHLPEPVLGCETVLGPGSETLRKALAAALAESPE